MLFLVKISLKKKYKKRKVNKCIQHIHKGELKCFFNDSFYHFFFCVVPSALLKLLLLLNLYILANKHTK